MGCSSSKAQHGDDVEMRPPRQVQVSGPIGGPQMVPPPYRDASGMPIIHQAYDLDRDTIVTALDTMTDYLRQQGVSVEAITVGGAVNTIYLRSRTSTHDVDFFLGNSEASQHSIIHQAARHANRQAGRALGGDWFNNSTQVFMSPELQHSLAEAAIQQGVVIYDGLDRHGGLRVYAAPWSYAFCGKLNRLCEQNPRPYDIQDAVGYLDQYFQTAGCTRVSAERIQEWCQRYRKKVTPEVLRAVDEEYRRQYGRRAIEW